MRARLSRRPRRVVFLTAVLSAAALVGALGGAAETRADSAGTTLVAPTVTVQAGPTQAEAVLDHFNCYSGDAPSLGRTVVLDDQFEANDTTVAVTPLYFCNPVAKTVGGRTTPIKFPYAHLICYVLSPRPPMAPRTVFVEDQFGLVSFEPTAPVDLCVPSAKLRVNGVTPPVPPRSVAEVESVLDHFKCYFREPGAGTTTTTPPLTLADQFGTSTTDELNGPVLLCNPVHKDGGPILHPKAHLSCYGLERPLPPPGITTVEAENQFGSVTFDLTESGIGFVCAPALKFLRPPPTEHFKCYRAGANTTNEVVSLTDQFATNEQATLFQIEDFCNPVRKVPGGTQPGVPPAEIAHLNCYTLENGTPVNRVVETQDQFGTTRMRVLERRLLCVPTVKRAVDGVDEPPHTVGEVEAAVDHYKCYAVSPMSPTVPPVVFNTDQFAAGRDLPLPGPFLLCNPVSKNGGPVANPEKHLTCYINDSTPVARHVSTEDQFGDHSFDVDFGELLCAPATKTVLPPELSHFKCYDVKAGFKPTSVGLEDQFGRSQADLVAADMLCNPAEKQIGNVVTPMENPSAHLKCYTLREKPAFQQRSVEVTNQFGSQKLTVGKPFALCAPSSKSVTGADPGAAPTNLSHFKCYDVTGADNFERRGVILRDQFGREETSVKRPTLLCNPVEKTHDDVVFPIVSPPSDLQHLVCYEIKAKGFDKRTVRVRNQFGLETVKVDKPRLLCVPSTKRVL